ncbi:hypothetical protein CTEN210_11922 [Chaetoceros tenuissimus]|uniref:Uncharacterized protein n=1 Tax=Chaetoceros tenuissimus TaxID=426638 RepID=A0AAD3D269_9STRA|nr:hypothetical protein CTEN210_11922 [Chaetoceros tenuissimus]
MIQNLSTYFMLLTALLPYSTVSAFTAPTLQASSRSSQLSVKFDAATERWIPESTEETEGYDAFGTLLRAGPKPFLIRITNGDNYEQGVYKFMAQKNMNRMEAQGNFDAYLENPNDWAYQYLQEQKGGPKKDYVNDGMDPKSLILKGVWTGLVLAIAGRAIYSYENGVNFYDFLKQ